MNKNLDIISQSTDLVLNNTVNSLVESMPEHTQMLQIIQHSLPEIKRGTSLFCKTQSQFMDNMLTVSHPTPLRNARQILAEINKATEALKEAHFKQKKLEIELKIKQRDLELEKDYLKQDLLNLEIMEIMTRIDSSEGYISGAIRKLTNYTEQYKSILSKYGKQHFSEEDFENEEEEYHIKKAFDQALTAARSRNGIIDEGNLMYIAQIGINAGSAQRDIIMFLNAEAQLIQQGKEPTHRMVLDFLQRMYDKHKGSSKELAEHKGLIGTSTKEALLLTGKLQENK